MKRRNFLAALGAAAGASLAGCLNQLREHDAELGNAITIGDHTLVARDYQPLNETTRVTIQYLNVSNSPSDPQTLVNNAELQLGRDTYAPQNKQSDNRPNAASSLHSSELLPGELVQTSISFPATNENARAALTINDKTILLSHPERNITAEPLVDLEYERQYPRLSNTLETENATYEFKRLDFRDHLPIFGERIQITITNTSNQPLTFTNRDIILKSATGRETTPRDARNLAKNPIQPDETRTIEGTIFLLAPSERNRAYVAIDRNHDTLGTKHIREHTPRPRF